MPGERGELQLQRGGETNAFNFWMHVSQPVQNVPSVTLSPNSAIIVVVTALIVAALVVMLNAAMVLALQ